MARAKVPSNTGWRVMPPKSRPPLNMAGMGLEVETWRGVQAMERRHEVLGRERRWMRREGEGRKSEMKGSLAEGRRDARNGATQARNSEDGQATPSVGGWMERSSVERELLEDTRMSV